MNCIINGKSVNYTVSGDEGPNILLLHGWGDSSATFNKISQYLKSDYSIIALDLPGFGLSEAPEEAWGLDDYSHFINEFLIKIDRASISAVIGHSNGGAIAMRALSLGELKAANLVLLASSGIRTQNSKKNQTLKIIAKVGGALTVWLPKSIRTKIQNKFYGVIGSDYLVAPHMRETFKKVVSQDVTEDAKNLTMPALIMYGTKDKATPLSYGQHYASLIDGATLEIVYDADHFLHHTHAEQVGSKINEFLRAG